MSDVPSPDGVEVWVLYYQPADFPREWVVRRQVARGGRIEFDADLSARGVTLEACVSDLRERHPRTRAMAWLSRSVGDEPQIIGCWM